MVDTTSNIEQINELLKNGDALKAVQLCRDFIQKGCDDAYYYNLLGICYIAARQYHNSVKSFQIAITKEPRLPEYYTNITKSYIFLRCYREAMQACKKALEINQYWLDSYIYMAHIYLQHHQLLRAEINARKAHTINPDHAYVHYLLGNINEKRKKTERALSNYKAAIKLDPFMAEANRSYGLLLHALGKYKIAIIPLQKTLKVIEHDAHVLFALGHCYMASHRIHDAIVCYKKVVELQPHNPVANYQIGQMYFKINEYEQANHYYSKALSLQPNYKSAYISKGYLHILMDHKNESKQTIEQANRVLDEVNDTGLVLLTALYEERYGNVEKALALLQKSYENKSIKSNHMAPLICYHQAIIQEKLGHYEAAFCSFEASNQFIALTPASQNCQANQLFNVMDYCKQAITQSSYAHIAINSIKDAAEDPVFVVGFPESGSANLCDILNNSKFFLDTQGAPIIEEIYNDLPYILDTSLECPEAIHFISQQDVIRLRHYYHERILALHGQKAVNKKILDHRPINLIYLPLIQRLFPDAVILNMQRDPRDVVIECFTKMFPIDPVTINFVSLDQTVFFYKRVMELYEHYQSIMGMSIKDVCFDHFSEKPLELIQWLYAKLDLPLEKEILQSVSSHHLQKIVHNKAAEEHSKTGCTNRWRHFSCQLMPYLELLDPSVSQYKKVTESRMNIEKKESFIDEL